MDNDIVHEGAKELTIESMYTKLQEPWIHPLFYTSYITRATTLTTNQSLLRGVDFGHWHFYLKQVLKVKASPVHFY